MAALFAVAASACVSAADAQRSFAFALATHPTSSAAPASVDFGSVQMGMSSDPVTVTLLNTGSVSLSFWRFGIASSSANPSDFSVVAGGTCTIVTALGSGESCTVLVRFKPTTTGARSGLLSFWDNTLAGRINVALSGTALPAAESSVSPVTLDFGPVQVGSASDPATVTVTNAGAGALSFWRFGIASSSANPSDFFVVAGGTCSLSLTLASGESCTVLVRFKPTAPGARSALLSFWDNTLTGRINAGLSGAALPGPESALSPAAIDFGSFSIGESSSPATVTITNSGNGSLSFWRIGIATSSLNASDFAVVAGGTCVLGSMLANGESCIMLVRFRPTAGGVRSALLSFWDNTLAGRVNVALTGIGNDPCGAGCF